MQHDAEFFSKLTDGFTTLNQISKLKYTYNKRKLVLKNNLIKLFHYQTKTEKSCDTPTLIVFATVNRPEILDLQPHKSFIHGLLQHNVDVYLLDWGYPQMTDQHISMTNYIEDIQHCVKRICATRKVNSVNVIGICQGGVLALCYAALFQNIKNLVLISTPINFHTKDNTIAKLLREVDMHHIITALGNMPGAWLKEFFISLRPFELKGKKYLRFLDKLHDETHTQTFLQVEKWLHDAPDQPGVAFLEFIENFYQKNNFMHGECFINQQKINLKNIKIPVLNVMARNDEIIPNSASRHLKRYIMSPDCTNKYYNSGHIGIYISEKIGQTMPKFIAKWLSKRD